MRILVIGGTGFIGRHLVARLSADQHQIVVPTRLHSRGRDLQILPTVTLLECDVHDDATLDGLLADKVALTKVLTYHVVPGKVMASDVKAGKVKTVQGQELTVSTSMGVMVDQSKVVATDVAASNGVIHAIDTVLMPK